MSVGAEPARDAAPMPALAPVITIVLSLSSCNGTTKELRPGIDPSKAFSAQETPRHDEGDDQSRARRSAATLLTTCASRRTASAQDRLKSMPGYEQYTRMAPLIVRARRRVGIWRARRRRNGATWAADGKSFEFESAGKRMRYDVATQGT